MALTGAHEEAALSRVPVFDQQAMTLRYTVLTQTEVAAKFLHASPLDHLRVPAMKR